jgi:hypothetical protein
MDTFLEVIPFEWYINLSTILSVDIVKNRPSKIAITTKGYSVAIDEDEHPGIKKHIFRQLRAAALINLQEELED